MRLQRRDAASDFRRGWGGRGRGAGCPPGSRGHASSLTSSAPTQGVLDATHRRSWGPDSCFSGVTFFKSKPTSAVPHFTGFVHLQDRQTETHTRVSVYVCRHTHTHTHTHADCGSIGKQCEAQKITCLTRHQRAA